LEGVINDQPEQESTSDSGCDSGDEESPALRRRKASEQGAKRITADHDPLHMVFNMRLTN
jgi:hypothetical protein